MAINDQPTLKGACPIPDRKSLAHKRLADALAAQKVPAQKKKPTAPASVPVPSPRKVGQTPESQADKDARARKSGAAVSKASRAKKKGQAAA